MPDEVWGMSSELKEQVDDTIRVVGAEYTNPGEKRPRWFNTKRQRKKELVKVELIDDLIISTADLTAPGGAGAATASAWLLYWDGSQWSRDREITVTAFGNSFGGVLFGKTGLVDRGDYADAVYDRSARKYSVVSGGHESFMGTASGDTSAGSTGTVNIAGAACGTTGDTRVIALTACALNEIKDGDGVLVRWDHLAGFTMHVVGAAFSWYKVRMLTDLAQGGGPGTATVLEWNGSAWVDSFGPVNIYDSGGFKGVLFGESWGSTGTGDVTNVLYSPEAERFYAVVGHTFFHGTVNTTTNIENTDNGPVPIAIQDDVISRSVIVNAYAKSGWTGERELVAGLEVQVAWNTIWQKWEILYRPIGFTGEVQVIESITDVTIEEDCSITVETFDNCLQYVDGLLKTVAPGECET